jgi:hypothetical protein
MQQRSGHLGYAFTTEAVPEKLWEFGRTSLSLPETNFKHLKVTHKATCMKECVLVIFRLP